MRASAVGGGFGGKEDFPSADRAPRRPAGARLRPAGASMVYDRHEDIVGTSKRHPAIVRHRTGVDARRPPAGAGHRDPDGRRRLHDALAGRALARRSCTPSAPTAARTCASRGRVLRTHTAPNSAFRGFGAPQVEFAVERQMDRIARAPGARSVRDPAAQRGRAGRPPADRAGPRRQSTVGPRSVSRRRRGGPASASAGGSSRRPARADGQDGEPLRGHRPLALLPRRRLHRQRRAADESPVTARLLDGRPHRGAHRDDRHGPGLRRGLPADRRGRGRGRRRGRRLRRARHRRRSPTPARPSPRAPP